MAYIDDTTTGYLRGSANLAFFFRVGTTPALHLTLGVNDIPIGIPVLDPGGTVYKGAGRLLSIPALETLINGLADKVSFSVSGVDADFMAQFASSSPPVLGAIVSIGLVVLDERFQPLGSITPLWRGTGDFLEMSGPTENDTSKNLVRTISLVCATGDQLRSNPALRTYTPQSQKTIYPTDDFCNNVPRYYQGQLVSWPRYT